MVTTKKLLFPRFEFAFYSYPSRPLRFSPCPVGHLRIRLGESTVSRFLAFMLDVSSCRFASFLALQNMSLTPQDTQNRGKKRSPLSRLDVAVRLMHHDPSDLESYSVLSQRNAPLECEITLFMFFCKFLCCPLTTAM